VKTVAICGFASTTRDGVRRSTADEIWSLNWVYNYDFLPRIDRLFEMHPIWLQAQNAKPDYEKPREHWIWLQEQHPFPIYMLEHRPEVPACVVYPLDRVSRELFDGRLIKGKKPLRLFGSSMDYMMALAICEDFERIEFYGVEMGSMTEYRYQRESLMLFIGMALSRGIEVVTPKDSILLSRTKLYMYEGGQMIYRQDLERLYNNAKQMVADELAKLQFMEGRLSNATEMELLYKDPGKRAELEREKANQERRFISAEAMMNAFEYLIREIDGEETELKITDPINRVKI